MKLAQIIVASSMMLAFSFASAAGFEGFFGNGYHYSVKITKNADGTYKMEYADSNGADDTIECTATAKLNGEKLVLVTDRDCTETLIDDDEKEVTKKFTKSEKYEYVITEAGIDEYSVGNAEPVENLERMVE
jgi:hypothetical protein